MENKEYHIKDAEGMKSKRLKSNPEALLGAAALLMAAVAIAVFLLLNTMGGSTSQDATGSNDFELININTATVKELQQLDEISESLAQKVVEYREENGDFESVDELLEVSGIGEKKLKGIRNYIIAE